MGKVAGRRDGMVSREGKGKTGEAWRAEDGVGGEGIKGGGEM